MESSIISITLKNFKSFREKTEISFESIRSTKENTNLFTSKEKKLLKILSIHGLNSVGKSNLIEGICFFKKLVTLDEFLSDKIPEIKGFRFFVEDYDKPTSFEIKFIIDEVIYRYGITIKRNTILKEFLYKTVKRESLIFEFNDWENINYSKKYLSDEELIYIPDKFKETGITLLSYLLAKPKPNEIFDKIKTFFNNLTIIDYEGKRGNNFRGTFKFLDASSENRTKLSEMMKSYELGMEDFLYQKDEEDMNIEQVKRTLPPVIFEQLMKKVGENSESLNLTREKIKINVVHKIYDENRVAIDSAILDFTKYTSEGSKKLYSLAGVILNTLETGGVMVIDELDSFIQTIFVENILNKFQNSSTNPFNAQLIFTGHNPYIVDSANLRRDQILLVKKNKFGESHLGKLSDYKNIKDNNSFSKSYLNILKNELNEL